MAREELEPDSLERLLEEFMRWHLAGEVPDPVEYARRAGEDAPRLRDLIAVFLAENEPVLPSPAAARDLVERYGPDTRPSDALLEEFMRRHLAGEVPDPVEYARRAGEDAPRLRDLIAVFLAENEPVLPSPAAARDLVARYGEETVEAAARPRLLRRLLAGWSGADDERRRGLLGEFGAGLPALSLAPAASRSGRIDSRAPTSIVQLNHRGGARVEIAEDGMVFLEVYGLPPEFAGTRPLVAFPSHAPEEEPEMTWAGEEGGLGPGLVLARERVGEDLELHVTIGRLAGARESLAPLLAEIQVIGAEGER